MKTHPNHSLLERQLRRVFGQQFMIPAEWRALIRQVDEAYREFDTDRAMIEHSLELSSQELLDANAQMRAVFQAIPELVFRLDHSGVILDVKAGASGELMFERENVLGKKLDETSLRQVASQFSDAIHRVTTANTLVDFEFSAVLQGQESSYEARLVPLAEKEIVVIVRDVTEGKQSLRLLGAAVEQSTESIVITDTELDSPGPRILFVNPAFTRMTGYTAAEVLGKTPRILQGPASDRAVLRRLRETLIRGEVFAGETVNYRKDGTVFDSEWQITPLRNSSGRITHFLGIQRDITARRLAERALLESEERFRFLNDLSEATRMLSDPEQIMAAMSRILGQHLRASRCAYADVEADGEQFTIVHDYTDGCASTAGKYQLSLFGPRAVDKLHHGQTLIIRNVEAELLPNEGADMFSAIGIKAIITCPLIKAGGLRAMMAVHQATPRDWRSGEIALVQEVCERCWATIERRAAEEKLRESEALLRIASRAGRLGGWADDLAEDSITWSDEVCAIHDLPPGTVPKLEYALSFYTPQSRERVVESFNACAQHGTPYDLELELTTAKGRHVWVRLIGEAQRNAAGTITRVQGAFQDITARKEAELELEQAHAQLVAVSRQAGIAEFATGILHNVGNVLNSVNVASACVAATVKGSKSANLAKVVAMLKKHENDLGAFLTTDPKGRLLPGYLADLAAHLASEQAGALEELAQLQKHIEHIREIVTTQQGLARAALSAEEAVNVIELVEGALKIEANDGASHPVRVIREFKDTPLVAVEKNRVLQILVNLVNNARQACDGSGRGDSTLTIRTTRDNGQVHIAVADNGAGISAENLGRIFVRGFTTKLDGHGFGLNSAARAAKELGGSLTAQSDGPGCGATFTLKLPCVPESVR